MAKPGPTGNRAVAGGIALLFDQEEYADCCIIFKLDPLGLEGGGAGSPLMTMPAHRMVLQFASDKLKAQTAAHWQPPAAAAATGGADPMTTRSNSGRRKKQRTVGPSGSAPLPPPLPEVLVFLDSAAELTAARAAIKFAYTGELDTAAGGAADVVGRLLDVWKQALYLQVAGCADACKAAVLEAVSSTQALLDLFSGQQASRMSDLTSAIPDLAGLLAQAKRRLVAHFRDAPTVLSSRELAGQMEALSDMGMEALLESDDFGTDVENSVLLLLAQWMEVNSRRYGTERLRRLCGLLRLVQCDRAYLGFVLPILAAHHEGFPGQPDWLPITRTQATLLLLYKGAPSRERTALKASINSQLLLPRWARSHWLSETPRRIHGTAALAPGWSHGFRFTVKDLVPVARGPGEEAALQPGGETHLAFLVVPGAYDNTIVAHGLYWRPYFEVTDKEAAVGLQMRIPPLFEDLAAETGSEAMLNALVARLGVRVGLEDSDGDEVWQSAVFRDKYWRKNQYNSTRLALPAGGSAAARISPTLAAAVRWSEGPRQRQDGSQCLRGCIYVCPREPLPADANRPCHATGTG